jgi:hypothetical protein
MHESSYTASRIDAMTMFGSKGGELDEWNKPRIIAGPLSSRGAFQHQKFLSLDPWTLFFRLFFTVATHNKMNSITHQAPKCMIDSFIRIVVQVLGWFPATRKMEYDLLRTSR